MSIGDWNFLHISQSAPCQEMPPFTHCMESIITNSKNTCIWNINNITHFSKTIIKMYCINRLFPILQYTECVHLFTCETCKVGNLRYVTHEVTVEEASRKPPSSFHSMYGEYYYKFKQVIRVKELVGLPTPALELFGRLS